MFWLGFQARETDANMDDQARALRELMCLQSVAPASGSLARPKLIIAVSGARGGVGATTVAVNLAVVLARRGLRTALVDADPYSGDIALRCGVQEHCTLADVLSGRRSVREALQGGPGSVLVLPGAWAQEDIAQASSAAQQQFVEQLQGLGDEANCVVVDTGSSPGRLARRLWLAADQVVLVSSAEVASIMGAYGLAKALAAGNKQIVLGLVVNMVADVDQALRVHGRLARACFRFLGLSLGMLGYVPLGEQGGGEGPCQLLVLSQPESAAAQQIQRLADALAAPAKLASFCEPLKAGGNLPPPRVCTDYPPGFAHADRLAISKSAVAQLTGRGES